MTKINFILGVVGVVLGAYCLVALTGQHSAGVVGAQIGTGDTRTNPMWLYGGVGIGSSGQALNNLVFGTCTLTGPTTLTAGTSTTAAMSCAATGVKSGDVVSVDAPATMPAGWTILGSSASTTASVITVILNNQSATTTIPSTAKAGIQYQAMRP
jgi:hypothetical protein